MSTQLSEVELIDIIATVLVAKTGGVTMASRIGSVEGWDSMGHLGILVALDEKLDGKAADIEELAMADSVQSIADILKSHGLVKPGSK